MIKTSAGKAIESDLAALRAMDELRRTMDTKLMKVITKTRETPSTMTGRIHVLASMPTMVTVGALAAANDRIPAVI
jgi:hypothetical protein